MRLAGGEWTIRPGDAPRYGLEVLKNGEAVAQITQDELDATRGVNRGVEKALGKALRRARKAGTITLEESAAACRFHGEDDQGEDEE
jgi:hypothetical protein